MGSNAKVGCCGFSLSQERYFRQFRLVEIQHTFYRVPRLITAEKWRQAAPSGFEFTLKAWQLITHEPSSLTYRRLGQPIEKSRFDRYGFFRPTQEVHEAWEQTLRFACALGATLLVFQCPASFRPTEENIQNLRGFFGGIDRKGIRCAWEPRGEWPKTLVSGLCQELRLIHCVDPFQGSPLYGSIQYFRLHGVTGYSYRYTDQDLRRLLGWVRRKPSYVLLNNIAMKDDAQRFLNLLQK